MKRRRTELEAKYGLEFSASGGGACYPSGLSGGTAFRGFSFWSLCAEAAVASMAEGLGYAGTG